MDNVYNFTVDLNWQLVSRISEIDRFDASWSSIERQEGQNLKHLRSIATVRSVGASTRIEGSKMSDTEVHALIGDMDVTKLEDRDSQEVAGYFETLDLIVDSHPSVEITESSLKSLHNTLLKHSVADAWHRGDYKQHSNAVEAVHVDGSRQVLFQTTPPGFQTEDAMRNLIQWYKTDDVTHPLVKCAAFAYDFVSIHPFQDGNGRMSRLLSTLTLLKHGYQWIQYVSFEHEIEHRKAEYYGTLRSCQAGRPNENMTEWVNFFLDALRNIQGKLMEKLQYSNIEKRLSPKEKAILSFIRGNPGVRSGLIASKLGIPNYTVKRTLKGLLGMDLIESFGAGAGTNYGLK